MDYPKISFAIAISIWFLALFFSTDFFLQKPRETLVSLEISASDFGAENHEIHKTSKQKGFGEKKHDLANDGAKNLIPLYQPLPAIPNELRDEAFISKASARFYIAKDGTISKVILMQPCANPQLNHLLLKSLQKWKFSASDEERVQDISVNFEVK